MGANEKVKKLKEAVKELREEFRPIVGATFVSIDRYRAKGTGEVSKRVINIMGIPYRRILEKDIQRLDKLHDSVFPAIAKEFTSEVAQKAFDSVQESNRKSVAGELTKAMEAQRLAYVPSDVAGMKTGVATGKIYIYGYSVQKKVLEVGDVKEVKSTPMTLAKNAWRGFMKSSRYRNFILENARVIKSGGRTIEVCIQE